MQLTLLDSHKLFNRTHNSRYSCFDHQRWEIKTPGAPTATHRKLSTFSFFLSFEWLSVTLICIVDIFERFEPPLQLHRHVQKLTRKSCLIWLPGNKRRYSVAFKVSFDQKDFITNQQIRLLALGQWNSMIGWDLTSKSAATGRPKSADLASDLEEFHFLSDVWSAKSD